MGSSTFSSSGTFTAPAGVAIVTVECYGGGGGGGAGGFNCGSGGGGGAYAKANTLTVVPGNNYTVTVGTGGSAGVSSGSGGAGGDSWFNTSGTVLAKGGGGGSGSGGAAGTATAGSIGDTTYSGGAGVNGTGTTGGGGGGGAGTTANGGDGSGVTGGTGGSSNGGAGGNGSTSTVGSAGSTMGGAGGGGFKSFSGAAGAAGQVVVTWVDPTTYTAVGRGRGLGVGTGLAALTTIFVALGKTTGAGRPLAATAVLNSIFSPTARTTGRGSAAALATLSAITRANYGPDLTITYTGNQVRNDIIATGGTLLTTVTESFTADGTAFRWPLAHIPDFSTGSLVPSLVANGGARTVGQAGSGAPSTHYVITAITPDYAVLQSGTDGVPGNNVPLVLTYQYAQQVTVRLQNQAAVTAAAGLPNHGYLTDTPASANSLTIAGAFGAAQAQLTLFATPFYTVQCTVPESFAGYGIQEGQQITFVSNRLGFNRALVITEIQWKSALAPGHKVMHLVMEG